MSIQPAIVQSLEMLFQESLEKAGVPTRNSIAHNHNNTENREQTFLVWQEAIDFKSIYWFRSAMHQGTYERRS